MAFQLNKSECYHFKTQEELTNQLVLEKKTTSRISIKNFIDRNCIVTNDKYYGDSESKITFIKEGLQDFCKLIKIPSMLLVEIKEEGLSSQLLNDRIKNLKDKIQGYDFILNEKNEVLGCVSKSYKDISNYSFIDKIMTNKNLKIDDFDYSSAFLINTKLSLRLLSKEFKVERERNKFHIKNDKSRIGLEFRNSMVGTSAISALIFIERLICSNGLSVVAGQENWRVVHRGSNHTFDERIESMVLPILRKMNYYKKWIDMLMTLSFSPTLLVQNKATKLIYDLFPLNKNEIEERKKFVGRNVQEFDINRIKRIPYRLKGQFSSRVFDSPYRNDASMFDFINIFTEHAQMLKPQRRLENEESAGKLANWIYQNRKKFN